jgi:putative membrane protein
MDGFMGVGMASMGLTTLVWTLFVIGSVVLTVVLAVRALRRPGAGRGLSATANEDWTAEDILRVRYARGELDGDEFRRRMNDLQEI